MLRRQPLRSAGEVRYHRGTRSCFRLAVQMQRNGSQAVRHALDLQAWLAEMEQQAEMQPGCFEVIDTLGAVRLVQCFHGLQLDQKRILDQQVNEVLADHRALVGDRDAALLREAPKPSFSAISASSATSALMRQRQPRDGLTVDCKTEDSGMHFRRLHASKA